MLETRVLRVLSDSAVRILHADAHDVVAEKGVRVESEALRTRLADGGARVDLEERVVRFPKHLVQQALEACPKTFVMHDPAGNELTMAVGSGHLMTYGEALNILDYGATRYRSSTLEGLIRCLKLAEQMPEVVGVCEICIPTELQELAASLEAVRAVLGHASEAVLHRPPQRSDAPPLGRCGGDRDAFPKRRAKAAPAVVRVHDQSVCDGRRQRRSDAGLR